MNKVLGDAAELMKKRMYSQAAELLQGLSVEQLPPDEKIEYEYLMGIYFLKIQQLMKQSKNLKHASKLRKTTLWITICQIFIMRFPLPILGYIYKMVAK